jgi:hypothetical protein
MFALELIGAMVLIVVVGYAVHHFIEETGHRADARNNRKWYRHELPHQKEIAQAAQAAKKGARHDAVDSAWENPIRRTEKDVRRNQNRVDHSLRRGKSPKKRHVLGHLIASDENRRLHQSRQAEHSLLDRMIGKTGSVNKATGATNHGVGRQGHGTRGASVVPKTNAKFGGKRGRNK